MVFLPASISMNRGRPVMKNNGGDDMATICTNCMSVMSENNGKACPRCRRQDFLVDWDQPNAAVMVKVREQVPVVRQRTVPAVAPVPDMLPEEPQIKPAIALADSIPRPVRSFWSMPGVKSDLFTIATGLTALFVAVIVLWP